MNNPEFTVYESHNGPVDLADRWVSRSMTFPFRWLFLALLAPIVLVLGNDFKLLFHWSYITEAPFLDAQIVLLSLAPVFTFLLLGASRVLTSVKTRAWLCMLGGLVPVGIITFYSHWAIGALFTAALLVAVGNRVAKQFTVSLVPRLLTGIGGLTLLAFFVIPLNERGPSIFSMMFKPEAWSKGGWALGVGLLLLFSYSLAGFCMSLPLRIRGLFSKIVSVTLRLSLLWIPVMPFIATVGFGNQFLRFFNEGTLTIATAAFKALGIAYPIMMAAGLGAAALLTLRLWGAPAAEPEPWTEPQPEPQEAY